ncbi:MAG TPA: ABC transporter ATP-binding protein [Firmicutes bacterium]|nr:ABC transporter ATP-binding protein [Bacillota bacterium]
MLNFRRLSAAYGKRSILEEVSFPVVPHKITAVIGKNGCGKSTLFSCLNQERPYTGEIAYSDRSLALMAPRERARLLGLLPQVLTSPPVSVQELVAFGRQPYLDFGKRLAEADRQAIEEAIAEIGLEGLRHQRVDRLSGGERQKAFLAMVLAQRTRILALDEPTTYMDMAYQAEFFRLLAMLKQKRKVTVLLILHDLAQALQHADYIVLLDQKRVAFYGTAEECAASGLIPAVFGVQMHEFFENGKRFLAFS